MRFLTLVTAAAVVAFAANSAAVPAVAAPALTGQMAQVSYLLGTWSCTTKLPANGKMAAQTISGKIVYWVDSGNTIGSHLTSKVFSQTGYMGWMDSKKLWWSDGADMSGGVSYETGKDSGTNVQTMTGTNWYQGQTATSRDTVTKISDSSYTDAFALTQGGKLLFQGSSACTKTSNSSM